MMNPIHQMSSFICKAEVPFEERSADDGHRMQSSSPERDLRGVAEGVEWGDGDRYGEEGDGVAEGKAGPQGDGTLAFLRYGAQNLQGEASDHRLRDERHLGSTAVDGRVGMIMDSDWD